MTKLAAGEPADPSWRVTLHFHPDRLTVGPPILAAHTLPRTTFCYPDSFHEPKNLGVASRLSALIALAEADDAEATALARDGALDPGVIGHASRTGRYNDQHLKRVWHYVARFGTPGIRS